jgi:hypothetical protein
MILFSEYVNNKSQNRQNYIRIITSDNVLVYNFDLFKLGENLTYIIDSHLIGFTLTNSNYSQLKIGIGDIQFYDNRLDHTTDFEPYQSFSLSILDFINFSNFIICINFINFINFNIRIDIMLLPLFMIHNSDIFKHKPKKITVWLNSYLDDYCAKKLKLLNTKRFNRFSI